MVEVCMLNNSSLVVLTNYRHDAYSRTFIDNYVPNHLRSTAVHLLNVHSTSLFLGLKLGINTLNLSSLELASRNSTLKENVELAIGSALGLRKTEISPDSTEEAGSSPEETGLGTPVPSRRVQHARSNDIGHDSDNVVCVSGEDDGLGSETGGGQLGDEGVADRSDGRIVGEGVDEKERSDGPLSSDVVTASEGDTANGQEEDAHGKLTIEVEGPATEPAHEEPGKDSTDSTNGVLAERHGETVLDSHAGLLIEVGRITHKGSTAESLDHPGDTDNLSSTKTNALEEIQVRSTRLSFLFHLVGVNHHGDGLIGSEVDIAVADGETLERSLGLFDAAATDEPPGRFGSKVDSDDERNRPHPLQSKGNLVPELIIAGDHGTENTRGDELAENPAEVDVGSEISAEVGRADLRGVGGGEGLEDTPGNTDKDLSNEKLNQRLGEEDDEDEANAANESTDQGLAITEAISDDTVEEKTDDLTAESSVGETRLPSSCQLIRAVRLLNSKLLLERGIGEEVVEEDNIESLHNNAEGEKDGPQTSLLVELEGLHQAHVVLGLSSSGSFMSDVGVDWHRDRGDAIVNLGIRHGGDQ
jgi:hypothetical protein